MIVVDSLQIASSINHDHGRQPVGRCSIQDKGDKSLQCAAGMPSIAA
jgi:hypothetical protein